MKKGLMISFLLLLLVVSVFIGCSDDDEATIVSAAAAQGYVIGYINSYSGGTYLEYYTETYLMTNNGLTMDSIVVGDTIVDYRTDTYWNVYGDDNYHWAYMYDNDSPFYTPGDTAEVKYYRNGTVGTLNIELIDSDVEPNIILPVNSGDTVSLGNEITFLWNANQNADWYGLNIYSYRDSAGTSISRNSYYSQTDTIFTIPAASNIYDGYYYLYVMAVNGPGSGDPLNLNSGGLIGEIHSYTSSDYRLVYVGTGDANPVSDDNIEPGYDLGDASRAIMDQITGHKLHKDNH